MLSLSAIALGNHSCNFAASGVGMRITHIVTYECQHTAIFEDADCPKIGEMVPCVRCRKHVMVMKAPPEYRFRCRKCRFSKGYGTARINAEIGMVQHRKGRPDHIVDLYNGKVIVRTFGDYGQTQIAA